MNVGRALVFLAVVAGLAWAPPVASFSGNDAGSGTDAGQRWTNALPLPGDGTYAGAAAGADRDWYARDNDGRPTCVVLDVETASPRRVVLGLVSANGTTRYIESSGAGRLVLAAPNVVRTYVGFGAASPAEYSFTLRTTTPQVDGASDLGTETPFAGPCVAGKLAGPSALDLYVVSGNAGQIIDVSVASTQATAQAVLRDPSGAVLGTIASGDAKTFTLPLTGTYSMEMRSSSSSEYASGLMFGDPGPQPCRPNCLSLPEM